jgi:hypothetical protein
MEQETYERFLGHLNALPGIRADSIPWNESGMRDVGGDGLFRVTSPLNTVEYLFDYKTRISMASVGVLRDKLRRVEAQFKIRPLLLTERISDDLAEALRNQGIEYLDAGGNMYLNSPATHTIITGRRVPKDHNTEKSASLAAADLMLMYVLLRETKAIDLGYRELAQKSGISLGAVSNTFKTLLNTGYLERLKNKTYQIADYSKLLNRWDLGYAEALRPKLFIGAFTFAGSRSTEERIEKMQYLAEQGECLIGGELGAALMTNYLRPQQFVLHVGENYRALVTKLLLRPATNGEVVFLKSFGTDNAVPNQPWIAHPLLICAELLTQNDGRLQETANSLLDKYIRATGIHVQ